MASWFHSQWSRENFVISREKLPNFEVACGAYSDVTIFKNDTGFHSYYKSFKLPTNACTYTKINVAKVFSLALYRKRKEEQ